MLYLLILPQIYKILGKSQIPPPHKKSFIARFALSNHSLGSPAYEQLEFLFRMNSFTISSWSSGKICWRIRISIWLTMVWTWLLDSQEGWSLQKECSKVETAKYVWISGGLSRTRGATALMVSSSGLKPTKYSYRW